MSAIVDDISSSWILHWIHIDFCNGFRLFFQFLYFSSNVLYFWVLAVLLWPLELLWRLSSCSLKAACPSYKRLAPFEYALSPAPILPTEISVPSVLPKNIAATIDEIADALRQAFDCFRRFPTLTQLPDLGSTPGLLHRFCMENTSQTAYNFSTSHFSFCLEISKKVIVLSFFT